VFEEQVDAFLDQLLGGPRLEVADHLLRTVAVALDDHVDVLGRDRAGEDDVASLRDGAADFAGDGTDLLRGEWRGAGPGRAAEPRGTRAS
jgi:hypothetical protein